MPYLLRSSGVILIVAKAFFSGRKLSAWQERLSAFMPDQTSRFELQGTIPPIDAFVYRSVSKEKDMPKDAHNKAAEHHESAARSHKMAAEHHGKGDHGKGREELAKAQAHSKTAREHSEGAHGKSQSQK